MFKSIKPLFVAIAALFAVHTVHAQDSTATQTKYREIGLQFANFDSYGLTYRWGRPDAVWRTSLGLASASLDIPNQAGTSLTFQTAVTGLIGREWRKPISKLVDFRYGPFLSLGYGARFQTADQQVDNNYRHAVSSKLGFMAGVNFKIKDRFLLGVEVMPGISNTLVIDRNPQAILLPNRIVTNELRLDLGLTPIFSFAYILGSK